MMDILGGKEQIKHDIFISLSADGVQPFQATEYSYWLVVVTVLSLAPSILYKANNLLPVMIIPGPKEPKDLCSFLHPFISEIVSLSNVGRAVRIWNGTVVKVRVHLFFVVGDLSAMKKLTQLKGVNGLAPCRFCLIQGVFAGNMYYPHAVLEGFQTKNGKRGLKMKTWNINRLELRYHEDVLHSYDELRKICNEGTVAQFEDMKWNLGYSSLEHSPLLKARTLRAFTSFPPDIVHLLFQNVAKDIVYLWLYTDGDISDLSHLSESSIFSGVNKTLVNSASGISSCTGRNP